jgi:L-alanine-DL-glutamate epimerase-like enolase superfamily enzyme
VKPLSPGELAERLAALPVLVEGHTVDIGAVPVEGYYGGRRRPTAEVTLVGAGQVGLGENVDWTPEEQARFADVVGDLLPRVVSPRPVTIGALSARLLESRAHRHHRAAIEAAAIELALRQASTELFRLADRSPQTVRHCRSIGFEAVEPEGPMPAVERVLEAEPEARIKIDCSPVGWPESTWRALAATDRIVVVDFKREGSARQVALAHRHLPEAWLEDPPAATIEGPDPDGPSSSWRGRIALDGYVTAAADLDDPPVPPAAVNVKAPRVGGPLEALRCLDRCAIRGWHAYMGGMFEVGAGRRQARDLASLYTADSWNDLAPLWTGSPPSRTDDHFPGLNRSRHPP